MGQTLIGFEKKNDLDQVSFFLVHDEFGKKRFQRFFFFAFNKENILFILN